MGIILYTLVVSHLPFKSDIYSDKNQKTLLSLEIPFQGAEWDAISPACIQLLQLMLRKDQRQRLSISDVLAHPWLSDSTII